MRKVLRPLAMLIVFLSAQLAGGQRTGVAAKGDEPIAGQLLDVEGKPLAGVKMCLTSWRLMIWSPSLPADDPRNPAGCSFSTTDKSGHFSFPPRDDPCTLLVFSDDGYVVAKSRRFTFPLTIRLTPWAKLHGVLKIGNLPAPAGITVQATYLDSDVEDELGPWPYFTAATDKQGQFDFGRVLAGSYSVCRTLTPWVAGIGVPVTAPAGKVTTLAVPIIGQDVHGHISLPTELTGQRWHADATIIQRIVLPRLTLPANVVAITGAAPRMVQPLGVAYGGRPTPRSPARAIERRAIRSSATRWDHFWPPMSVLEPTPWAASFFRVIDNQTNYDRPMANAAYDFKIAVRQAWRGESSSNWASFQRGP